MTVGSPPSPFSQNKQNEPAVAVNPIDPSIVAAGVNEEVDMEACNNRADTTCPFTQGVGVSGVYFSNDSGSSWSQPTYSGWTARDCLGVPGTDPGNPADNCDPHPGPIGTLPRYYENGLVSDGDPAVGFGPQPDSQGHFSWSNGWRLYYANLTANFSAQRSEHAFKGFEAIGVSRLDSQNYAAAQSGDNTAWMAPVIASRQNAALFSDHEMVSVDDAASSPFFGNVYVCNAAFRSQEIGGFPEPIVLNASSDGGNTWRTTQLSPAVDNNHNGGRQDCAVNTDSSGTLYVFWDGFDKQANSDAIYMIRSHDGGVHFERPARIVTHFVSSGIFDPVGGFTNDGVAGARDGSFPTVDIANGAPSGADASDEIVLAWTEGPTPTDPSEPNERVHVLYSKNGGNSWHSGGIASPTSDRPDFPAIAISPNGQDAYLTYMSFLQPYQSTTADPRMFQGVVTHADVDPASGEIGDWSEIDRGPAGDARGSSANALDSEFLGDYNFAFATDAFAVAVWNDGRDASDCPAEDAYRQSLVDGTPGARPAVQQDCPATFGNTDIYGGSYPDPTP
ncbi:MAG: exo-alpha-sialidase [Actinobacteria bacterium]|nr:MAG: exo-alpha-sialidase [Actinomycetota bacterium]